MAGHQLEWPTPSPIENFLGIGLDGGLGKIFVLYVGDVLYISGVMWWNIIWIVLGMYTLGVLTYGWSRSEEVDVVVAIKNLASPYFRLGVSFTYEVYRNATVYVFSLGMFFVTLEISFIKNEDNAAAQSNDSSV